MPASSKKTRAEPARPVSERKPLAAQPPRASASKPRRDRASSAEDFKTSMLNIRVKADLKDQATATLEKLGISLPEAIRVFLGRVVSEQAIPFPLEVPNAKTAAALRESRSTGPQGFLTAEELFDALEKAGKQQTR